MTGMPAIALMPSQVRNTSMSFVNSWRMDGWRSKFTSTKYLKLLPNCLTAVDFPTCLAPLMSSGFLLGASFHSRSFWSMFLL